MGWREWFGKRTNQGEPKQPVPSERVRTGAPHSRRAWQPAKPTGKAAAPWARATEYVNVVGESQYGQSFRAAFKARGISITSEGREIRDASAHLCHDPQNPYDPNAIGVWIEGHLIGYLPRDVAADYAPALDELQEEGAHLCVTARIWASLGYDRELFASGSVVLPPRTGVQPFNQLPEESHVVLPHAKSVMQVTGEEQHMDVLGLYVADHPRHVAATLHLVTEQKTARSVAYEAVEVRLDGRRVGCLTRNMSEQVSGLVRHVAERGNIPVARATIKGSPLRAEVSLDAARSADVSSRWLDDVPYAS